MRMRNIKKYLAVAKIHFKAQLIYRFEVIMTALGTIWRVVFAWILWGAIFATREEVGGFTLPAMLSYYVVSSFLTGADTSINISFDVGWKIRGGDFSKFMVIPAHPQTYFLSQALGKSGYYALFAALTAAASVLLFGIDLIFTADPAAILLAIAMFLLGLVFMSSYHFFVGLWAFKFQDITFLLHGLPNVVSFFKGEYIPLSLLPGVVVSALRFLPFAHTVYTPAMLLTGRMGLSDGITGLGVLALWTAGMMAVSQLAYRSLRTKYEGVGI